VAGWSTSMKRVRGNSGASRAASVSKPAPMIATCSQPEASAAPTVEPEQPTGASSESRAGVRVERQASLNKAVLGLDVAPTKSRRIAESRSASVADAGARERLNVAPPAGSESPQVSFGNNRAPVLE